LQREREREERERRERESDRDVGRGDKARIRKMFREGDIYREKIEIAWATHRERERERKRERERAREREREHAAEQTEIGERMRRKQNEVLDILRA